MPYKSTGGNYPTVTYLEPENKAEKNWLDKINNLAKESIEQLPKAQIVSIQSINSIASKI